MQEGSSPHDQIHELQIRYLSRCSSDASELYWPAKPQPTRQPHLAGHQRHRETVVTVLLLFLVIALKQLGMHDPPPAYRTPKAR